jgi:cytochrome c
MAPRLIKPLIPQGISPMLRAILTSTVLLSLSAVSAQAADAARGGKRFKIICATCHAIDPAQRKKGPNLKGVVGRKAASIDGATYSAAMKAAGST